MPRKPYQNHLVDMNGIPIEGLRGDPRFEPLFATQAHPTKVSNRYEFRSTEVPLLAILAEGWTIVELMVARARSEFDRPYTRHMVRLRRADVVPAQMYVGAIFPEVMFTTSHMGNMSWQVYAALRRLACLNGMAAKLPGGQEIRYPHVGEVEDLVKATLAVAGYSQTLVEMFEQWAGIKLNEQEQLLFAKYVLALRFGRHNVVGAEHLVEEIKNTVPVRDGEIVRVIEEQTPPQTALVPTYDPKPYIETLRRPEDKGNSLQLVTSRIQELVVRGGVAVHGRRTQQINAIDALIDINSKIMGFGQELALAHQS